MKLSIAWIFDHIQGSFKNHDIPALVQKLSKTVCEVEDCSLVRLDLDAFTLGVVKKIDAAQIIVESSELQAEFSLPIRTDAQPGGVYLLKKEKKGWQWAENLDLSSGKDGLFPMLSVNDKQLAGSWKDSFEAEDYILEIDNVSLTHRPDLWGHRGFAREIAAMLELPLVDLGKMMAHVPVEAMPDGVLSYTGKDLAITIDDKQACRRFAAMAIPEIEQEGSWIWMAHRLARVDARPINGIVDATNYVMLDISQPLHAFDAEKVANHALIVRRARKGDSLELLDGQTLSLSPDNLVVSDSKQPLALAGIMGGSSSGVSATTTSLLLESASFMPSVIRKSSGQFKVRSEASARFEKNLDPNQNVDGLLRFAYLLEHNATKLVKPTNIISLGSVEQPKFIEITHHAIEHKLGLSLTHDQVTNMLARLAFKITIKSKDPFTYLIEVPSCRATKDVAIAEDITEEIARAYGLDKIPHRLPALIKSASSLDAIIYKDAILQYLAFGAGMHEVQNYAFFDEPFLQELGWAPSETMALQNPVSENHYRLVTSLVPNLLLTVQANKVYDQTISLCEINAIWSMPKADIMQQKSLAGIFYEAKAPIDFYAKKAILETMLQEIKIDAKIEKALPEECAAWYHPYKTMRIMHNNKAIGYAGIAHPGFIQKLGGSAFIFELDMDYLISADRAIVLYKPLAKYQDTWLDVSMLIPKRLTADQIKQEIKKAHAAIFAVELIDFFEKDEWADQRSITMRYFARDANKTLAGAEIDAIGAAVIKQLQGMGAQVR